MNEIYLKLLQKSSQNLKPVMFWVHGGGFFRGSGNCGLHGVDRFLSNGVIVVTINYRLGIFGTIFYSP